ncbi:hypothetical protein [Mycobacterium scrofulaceum]|nr:hypothetical protein [Mycobacterium scrofulaceum]
MPELAGNLFDYLMRKLVESLDSVVESPPPDEHDTVVVVTEKMPSLNVPIPDDPSLRMAFYDALGRSVDQGRVHEFLNMVWNHDAQPETPDRSAAELGSTSRSSASA